MGKQLFHGFPMFCLGMHYVWKQPMEFRGYKIVLNQTLCAIYFQSR